MVPKEERGYGIGLAILLAGVALIGFFIGLTFNRTCASEAPGITRPTLSGPAD